MISQGKSITQVGDLLSPISIDDLYGQVTHPAPAVEQLVTQLRTVRMIDDKRYQQLKRSLPYVVCATFNPALRKTDNFVSTECFIVDLDHLMVAGFDSEELKERLKGDDRVAMCFTSPGGDGLKVLFRLTEPCHDAGLYSIFYKQFVRQFALRHHLEQVVDTRTSDVCRACFVSVDRTAWRNHQAELVNLRSIVDTSDASAASDLRRELAHEEKTTVRESDSTASPAAAGCASSADPDSDVMARIRARLAGEEAVRKQREQQPVYVPAQVEQVMQGVRQAIEELGVEVTDVRDIQFGKKVIMRCEMRQAELNIFFGKKGFSVVTSPKRGTSQDLNELMSRAVENYLHALTN